MSAEESEDEKDQEYCREGTSKPVQEIEGALREGGRDLQSRCGGRPLQPVHKGYVGDGMVPWN